MIQNAFLKTGSKNLLVGSNPNSKFVTWLSTRFEKPVEVSSSIVKGVMNSFDSLKAGNDGLVFRGTLLEWLWENQGRTVRFEIQ